MRWNAVEYWSCTKRLRLKQEPISLIFWSYIYKPIHHIQSRRVCWARSEIYQRFLYWTERKRSEAAGLWHAFLIHNSWNNPETERREASTFPHTDTHVRDVSALKGACLNHTMLRKKRVGVCELSGYLIKESTSAWSNRPSRDKCCHELMSSLEVRKHRQKGKIQPVKTASTRMMDDLD